MNVNKASPVLFARCASGNHISGAVFTGRKAGGKQEEFLIMKFTDLMVSSFQTLGGVADVVPVDKISLNFSKIEIEYRTQNATGGLGGPVKTGYNLKTNKKV